MAVLYTILVALTLEINKKLSWWILGGCVCTIGFLTGILCIIPVCENDYVALTFILYKVHVLFWKEYNRSKINVLIEIYKKSVRRHSFWIIFACLISEAESKLQ